MQWLLRSLNRLYYRFFGSKRLLSFERLAFDAWRNSLSTRAQEILDAQLRSAHFIQRQAGGAKVCFYHLNQETIPLFRNQLPYHKVATVILTDARVPHSKLKVKIFVQCGRFFSLEFPKRPWRYLELHGMHFESLRVDQVITHVELE